MIRTRRYHLPVLASLAALVLPAAALADPGGAPASPAPAGAAARHDLDGLRPPADVLAQRLADARGRRFGQLSSDVSSAQGPISVYVQLDGQAAADAYDAARPKGKAAARRAAVAARKQARSSTADVAADLEARDSSTQVIFETANAVVGLGVRADAADVRSLAGRPDVVRISTLVPKRFDNANAAALTRTLESWQDLGVFGQDMRVGVIDTGIDYTHANFGGPGTPAAYDAIDPTVATPGEFPTAKVVGGYDFAGEAYDADSDDPAVNTPVPDANPLDCEGHGSHVAGTAGGFGVNADGTTFAGDYSALEEDALQAMRIGPGMAPQALLYALKVFGCSGSTFLVPKALEWSLDPNNDGDFSDHLDVVNISIGADYTTPDDPDNLITRRVIEHGVMAVFSGGNGGDLFDIGSEAPEALSVASTRDSYVLHDAIDVVAPGTVAGVRQGQYSIAFDYTGLDLTAPVAKLSDPGNLDGCQPLTGADAAAVAERIAWLEWDDNDATRRCGSAARANNLTSAGAAGVLLTSTLDDFTAGIAGNAVIPMFQMTGAVTTQLRPALEAGVLEVRMADELVQSLQTFNDDLTDTPSAFTSRGTRSPVVKPDLAAPGDTIVSTSAGTGNEGATNSGTSMASPNVAGIATLLRQQRPDWTPAMVKAGLMNTAGHDIFSGLGQTGPIEAPNRVGAGRVDARSALANTVLAYDKAAPAQVSVGFGVVEAAAPLVLTRTIRLQNTGAQAAAYDVAYQPITSMPGVSIVVSPSTVTVPAGQTADVDVQLRIADPAALRKTGDPTLVKEQLGVARQFLADASGRVAFTPTSGATESLRVPVYAAPKPVSNLNPPGKVKLKGDQGTLRLSGRGIAQGSGDQRYQSLTSVLELAATSPRLASCSATVTVDCAPNDTARGGDIRYVGVASAVPSDAPEQGMLGFGVSTWDNWANLGSNTVPFVDIDVDGDGVPDFETFAAKPVDTDVLVAATIDLDTGAVVDIQGINTTFGDVDTNVFDTNVVVMPVLLSALGIDPTVDSARISYVVGVAGFYSAPGSSLVDLVPDPLSFDPLRPGLSVDGAGTALLFDAQNKTTFTVHRDSASLAQDGSDSLLVLLFHNRSGVRDRVVRAD